MKVPVDTDKAIAAYGPRRAGLSGSSAKLLSREIATSLRGRTLSYRLGPFSFGEFLRFKAINYDCGTIRYSERRYDVIHALERYLEWGGFPEVVNCSEDLYMDILQNYFEMIVYRDIADRFSIRNSSALKSLFKYLLFNVSKLFSLNSYHGSTGASAFPETLWANICLAYWRPTSSPWYRASVFP